MEAEENKQLVYEFGRFVLDPHEKSLLVDGAPMHLRAKEFETLLLLIENNGRVVSKAQLMSTVWQDAFVEENNLVKQVSKLRKILNTNGDRFIETVPKFGYRFTADLQRVELVPETPAIVEKRVVKRLTVRLREGEEKTAAALPPKTKSRRTAGILVGILLLLGGLGSLAWFWKSREVTNKADETEVVFLTDASQDNNGATWVGESLIYFSKYVTSTRIETWVMNADGSDQRRANAQIKDLLHGRWSQDGKKVLFTKENDKKHYLADADGANEIALPFLVGNMDWSPDGTQFTYQSTDASGESQIFLYTIETRRAIQLTERGIGNADPSFSYDGKEIAFTSVRDGNPEIYVMNSDGSNVRRVTDHPGFDNYPVFAPDGTAIAFQSNRENEQTQIYVQNLNNALPPTRLSSFNGVTGISPKCWSADGTQILLYSNQNGKDQIALVDVDLYPATLVISDDKSDLSHPQISPDGDKILYQAQMPDRSIELRIAQVGAASAKTIFKTETGLPLRFAMSPAWSPDGSLIAFANKSEGNTEIFTVKPDGSDLYNVTRNPLSDTAPTFTLDGREIIFGRSDLFTISLYRMNLDGSDQRRVTQKDGYETDAVFCPDGSTILFAGDRTGPDSRGLDIFLLDFGNPHEERRLTARRSHEVSPSISPDGSKIIFVATSDGNNDLYVMNADGSGLFRLTRSKANEIAPQFSPDGRSLFFASDRNRRQEIYELPLPF